MECHGVRINYNNYPKYSDNLKVLQMNTLIICFLGEIRKQGILKSSWPLLLSRMHVLLVIK